MTKAEALYNFFSSFGLNAYVSGNVPESATLPYLTYELTIGNPGDMPTSINVGLWYHTESEAVPFAKVEQIAQAIGFGGVQLAYTGGSIWVRRGYPWCNSVTDSEDSANKLKQLNVELEFL